MAPIRAKIGNSRHILIAPEAVRHCNLNVNNGSHPCSASILLATNTQLKCTTAYSSCIIPYG
ncbi:MAG: hypothetical protein RID09_15915 [Coleofasciculus sp. G1-WW12-02]|uniref:hypothetical protein n=1 Tax=Coleofasciculus sp. G1-WW12-02 TaxID=3068483 RepID=UPI0033018242